MSNPIILIPALNPGEQLLTIITELKEAGLDRIVLVNDGSDSDCDLLFSRAEQKGCLLVTHETNLGKGAALKTGLRAAISTFGEDICVITADSDGQHKTEDILRVSYALDYNPDKLIMGVRDFSSENENVPARSRFGNVITSKLFKITAGVYCPDTQTGLRGIPSSLLDLALETEGTRYEYEMNFLSEASKKYGLFFVPIETIYEDNNSVSHFRPVRDSIRVYGRFFRFLLSSLSGFAVDYAAFALLVDAFTRSSTGSQSQAIIYATVLARILSGIVNFLMNKKFAFKSKGNTVAESVRYVTLFFAQMATSAALVAGLSLFIPAVVAKIIVDTCLFFVSFIVQKRWVFKSSDPSVIPGIPADPADSQDIHDNDNYQECHVTEDAIKGGSNIIYPMKDDGNHESKSPVPAKQLPVIEVKG